MWGERERGRAKVGERPPFSRTWHAPGPRNEKPERRVSPVLVHTYIRTSIHAHIKRHKTTGRCLREYIPRVRGEWDVTRERQASTRGGYQPTAMCEATSGVMQPMLDDGQLAAPAPFVWHRGWSRRPSSPASVDALWRITALARHGCTGAHPTGLGDDFGARGETCQGSARRRPAP
jgi:hypothetical protein